MAMQKQSPPILIFYKRECPFSERAIDDLRSAGIDENDVGIIVPGDDEHALEWWRRMGAPTFPQILVAGKLVPGGADGLRKLLRLA